MLAIRTLPLLVLLLAACEAGHISRKVTVDDSFDRRTIDWAAPDRPGGPGVQTIAARVIEADGMYELCGAWAVDDGGHQNSTVPAQLMHDLNLTADGRTVIEDFGFFARAPSAAALNGTVANCTWTDLPVADGPYVFDVEQIGDREYSD